MVDIVKRVNKNCAADLGGEQVLAATLGTPLGGFANQVAFGAVGGLIGSAAGSAMQSRERKAAEKTDEADGVVKGEHTLANKIPQLPCVLALTEQRLLIFKQGSVSGKPKELVASFDRSQISGLDVEVGKLKGKLKISFTDDSAATLEVLKGSKPTSLASAYEDS
jgi:hypothetical protein